DVGGRRVDEGGRLRRRDAHGVQQEPERRQDLVGGFQCVGQQEQTAHVPPPVQNAKIQAAQPQAPARPPEVRRGGHVGSRLNSMASSPGSLTPKNNRARSADNELATSGRPRGGLSRRRDHAPTLTVVIASEGGLRAKRET